MKWDSRPISFKNEISAKCQRQNARQNSVTQFTGTGDFGPRSPLLRLRLRLRLCLGQSDQCHFVVTYLIKELSRSPSFSIQISSYVVSQSYLLISTDPYEDQKGFVAARLSVVPTNIFIQHSPPSSVSSSFHSNWMLT